MTPPPSIDRSSVTLSRLFTPRSIARMAAAPHAAGRDAAAAAVLVAQARSRVVIALGVTVVQLAMVFWLGGSATPAKLLGIALAYAAFSGVLAIGVGRLERATPAVVTLALTGDIAFSFAMTVAGTTAVHYERALFGR